MNYRKFAMGLGLIFWLAIPVFAGDIQQGIHGMKWGSALSEYDQLTKVHETKPAAYYANSNMVYQSANQPVPGVFYGFYRDRFFAVFIKLRSPDQFSQLERQFAARHGKPKTTRYPETKQTVYRWKDDAVKIKLKMKEVNPPEYKLAIYYAPLADGLNEERLESVAAEAYERIPSQNDKSTKSVPLLD